jgi:hypothetical protein
MKLIALAILLIAAAIGVVLGLRRSPLPVVAAWSLGVFAISILGACVPYFTSDPKEWLVTYFSAVLLGGLASIAFHVLPLILCYYIGRFFARSSKA